LPLLFGLYGLIRKHVDVDPLAGLWIETLTFVSIALVYVAYLGIAKESHFGFANPLDSLFLLFAGPLTIIPLTLFAAAARRVNLTTIGITQYIAPSMAFLLAIFVLHEGFARAQLITFSVIWLSLAIFVVDGLRFSRVGARQTQISSSVE